MMRKKLLIIGHSRHGKDTVAEYLRDYFGYNFISSSEYVGRRAVWPKIATEKVVPLFRCSDYYSSFEECFEDRHNHRKFWADTISAYNTPDKTRTSVEMLEDGYDMYVGMRRRDELEAVKAAGIFDYIIWVDRSELLPDEDLDSMELVPEDADLVVDNNGTKFNLFNSVLDLMEVIGHDTG